MIYNNPDKSIWSSILERAGSIEKENKYNSVKEILADIKSRGNIAIEEYVYKYNSYKGSFNTLKVNEDEITNSLKTVKNEIKDAISIAYMNILKFHKAQITKDINIETMPGVICKQKSVAIENIGIYIPDGTAHLFSSIFMLAMPAQLEGCKNISFFTPCHANCDIVNIILYNTDCCGINII